MRKVVETSHHFVILLIHSGMDFTQLYFQLIFILASPEELFKKYPGFDPGLINYSGVSVCVCIFWELPRQFLCLFKIEYHWNHWIRLWLHLWSTESEIMAVGTGGVLGNLCLPSNPRAWMSAKTLQIQYLLGSPHNSASWQQAMKMLCPLYRWWICGLGDVKMIHPNSSSQKWQLGPGLLPQNPLLY